MHTKLLKERQESQEEDAEIQRVRRIITMDVLLPPVFAPDSVVDVFVVQRVQDQRQRLHALRAENQQLLLTVERLSANNGWYFFRLSATRLISSMTRLSCTCIHVGGAGQSGVGGFRRLFGLCARSVLWWHSQTRRFASVVAQSLVTRIWTQNHRDTDHPMSQRRVQVYSPRPFW